MRILVTGSSGHLGDALMRVLREDGPRGPRARHARLAVRPSVGRLGRRPERACARCMAGVDAVLHAATLHKPHVGSHGAAGVRGHERHGHADTCSRRRSPPASGASCSRARRARSGARSPAAGRAGRLDHRGRRARSRATSTASTKTAAEDLCELVHRDHGLPCLILRTSRFFPEADDRDDGPSRVRRRQPQGQRAALPPGRPRGRRRRAPARARARARARLRALHRQRHHAVHPRRPRRAGRRRAGGRAPPVPAIRGGLRGARLDDVPEHRARVRERPRARGAGLGAGYDFRAALELARRRRGSAQPAGPRGGRQGLPRRLHRALHRRDDVPSDLARPRHHAARARRHVPELAEGETLQVGAARVLAVPAWTRDDLGPLDAALVPVWGSTPATRVESSLRAAPWHSRGGPSGRARHARRHRSPGSRRGPGAAEIAGELGALAGDARRGGRAAAGRRARWLPRARAGARRTPPAACRARRRGARARRGAAARAAAIVAGRSAAFACAWAIPAVRTAVWASAWCGTEPAVVDRPAGEQRAERERGTVGRRLVRRSGGGSGSDCVQPPRAASRPAPRPGRSASSGRSTARRSACPSALAVLAASCSRRLRGAQRGVVDHDPRAHPGRLRGNAGGVPVDARSSRPRTARSARPAPRAARRPRRAPSRRRSRRPPPSATSREPSTCARSSAATTSTRPSGTSTTALARSASSGACARARAVVRRV